MMSATVFCFYPNCCHKMTSNVVTPPKAEQMDTDEFLMEPYLFWGSGTCYSNLWMNVNVKCEWTAVNGEGTCSMEAILALFRNKVKQKLLSGIYFWRHAGKSFAFRCHVCVSSPPPTSPTPFLSCCWKHKKICVCVKPFKWKNGSVCTVPIPA